MPTSQKNKAILFNPVGKDNITKSRIKQFWSENGAMNVQNLTDAAQKIIYEAWEADTADGMVCLAKQALTLSPFCLDAYNILAEWDCEPTRVFRRQFILSHATLADSSNWR